MALQVQTLTTQAMIRQGTRDGSIRIRRSEQQNQFMDFQRVRQPSAQ